MSRERAQSIGQRDYLSLHEEEKDHEHSADVYCIDANVELWQSIDFRSRKSRSRNARRPAAALPPQRDASFRLGYAQQRRYPSTLPSLVGGATVDTESSNDEDSFPAALQLLQSPPPRQALLPHLSPTAAGADSPIHSPDKLLAMPSRLGQEVLQPLQPLVLHSPSADAESQPSIRPPFVQEDEQPTAVAGALGTSRTPERLTDPTPNASVQRDEPEPKTPGGREQSPVVSARENNSPPQPHETPTSCVPPATSPQRSASAPSSPARATTPPAPTTPISNPIELAKTTEDADHPASPPPTQQVVDEQPSGLDGEAAVTPAILNPSSRSSSPPSTPPIDNERLTDASPSSAQEQHEQQPPAPHQADHEQQRQEEAEAEEALAEQVPAALSPPQDDGNEKPASPLASPNRSKDNNNDENDDKLPSDAPQTPPPPTTGSGKVKPATKKSSFTRTVNTQELPTVHATAAAGNVEQLQVILAHDAAVACSLDKHGRPAIFYAAAYAHADCVELLIGVAPRTVQLQDQHGNFTLHAAVSAGSVECVQLLLEAGQANPDCSNRDGMTPAHLARDRECLEQLFYAGCALDMLDNNGRSPLFLACALDKSDCVAFLLDVLDEASESLARQDSRGDTALHAAACNGSFQSMLHLLQMAADPNVVNAKGLKPIDLAVQHGHDSTRQLLAEYTLHYTSTSEFDSTFFFALLKGHKEVKQAVSGTTLERLIGQQTSEPHERPSSQAEEPSPNTLYTKIQSHLSRVGSMWSLRADRSVRLQTWGTWIAYEDQTSHVTWWYDTRTGRDSCAMPNEVREMQEAAERESQFGPQRHQSMRLKRVDGWLEFVSGAGGNKLWYNEFTGESRWVPAQHTADGSPQSAWQMYHDPESGLTYWYNPVTGVSQWEPPTSGSPAPQPQAGDDCDVVEVLSPEDLGV